MRIDALAIGFPFTFLLFKVSESITEPSVLSKGENFIKMRVAQSLPSFDIKREIMKSMKFFIKTTK